jgi:hypothetical protein
MRSSTSCANKRWTRPKRGRVRPFSVSVSSPLFFVLACPAFGLPLAGRFVVGRSVHALLRPRCLEQVLRLAYWDCVTLRAYRRPCGNTLRPELGRGSRFSPSHPSLHNLSFRLSLRVLVYMYDASASSLLLLHRLSIIPYPSSSLAVALTPTLRHRPP